MSSQSEVTFELGGLNQVSIVVADIEDAARRYEPVFGPFRVVDVPAMAVSYRGAESTVTQRLAFASSGGIEIELVQVVEGDSPAKDHLDANGESIHHLRFPVDDVVATRESMEAVGYRTAFAGSSGPIFFAYLEPPDGLGPAIELISGLPAE